MVDRGFTKTRSWKVLQILIFLLLYAIGFWLAYPMMKSAASSLGVMPIVAAGQAFGLLGGLVTGGVTGGLTLVLLALKVGAAGISLQRGLMIIALDVLLGGGVGWLGHLTRRAREQTEQLVRTESALRSTRDELEQHVEARTKELLAANETLRQSEERLQMALEGARVGTWEWNYKTNQITWSKGIGSIFGINDELLPDTYEAYRQRIYPEDADRLDKAIQAALMHPQQSFEFSFRAPDSSGNLRWMGGRGRVDVDKNGNMLRVAGTLSDITDRKQIEEATRQMHEILETRVTERTSELQAERDFARQVMESMGQGLIIYDPQLNGEYANPAAEQMLGYSAEKLIHTNILDVVAPEDRPRVLAGRDERMQGKAGSYELRMIAADGSIKDILLTAAPHHREGKIIGGVAVMTDMTGRKRTEDELRRAKDAAEAATRAKSAFLASMSHEIRTPMNGIIGMTELLLGSQPLTSDQRYYAETIRSSGNVLLAIINDILDFSKIEAGKMEMEYYPFQLREVIESVLESVAFQAAQNNIELVYLISAEVPEIVLGDSIRLHQILSNLIGNAVKFTEKGEVVVQVFIDKCDDRLPADDPSADVPTSTDAFPSQEADSRTEQCILRFEVRDSGIGIPPERLEDLFQSFSQVDITTARKYGGTGLGLAISRRLVEMMGGGIWAESLGIPGKGSIFTFTVRLDVMQVNAGSLYSWRDFPELLKRRLLLVEAHPLQRLALSELVQSWGMQVTAVGSAQAALDYLRQADVDSLLPEAALLDLTYPDDSLELAVEIHRSAPGIPLALLAGLFQHTLNQRLSEVAAIVNKPVRAAHLSEILISLLSGQTQTASALSTGEVAIDTQMAERIPLRILVAEDNAVNQQLAMLVLRQFGYRADLAENGQEVLDALQRQPYDVILMDVQMPLMDGLEAARRINQLWSTANPPSGLRPDGLRPYIIAITASALREQRQACLDAGMDDFVSKPITARDLASALENAAGHRTPVSAEKPILPIAPVNPDQPPLLDPSQLQSLAALQRTDGQNTLAVMLELFLEELPESIIQIQRAVQQSDPSALKSHAHKLKGACRAVGALRLGELCLQLESMGREGQITITENQLSELELVAKLTREAFEKRLQETAAD